MWEIQYYSHPQMIESKQISADTVLVKMAISTVQRNSYTKPAKQIM